MSYHLRALERWGIVERADARTDGRERPWRGPGRSLSLVSDLSTPAIRAQDLIVDTSLQQLRDEFHRWSSAEANETAQWREGTGLSRSLLWLTAAETAALSAELNAVVDKYDIEGRDTAEHPESSRRLLCLLAIVPIVPSSDQPRSEESRS